MAIMAQSYALDALDWLDPSKGKKAPPESEIRNFVDGLQKTSIKAYPSLGLGENVRMEGPFISGAALVHEGKVLHLSAFSHSGHKNDKIKVPFSRFSRRRKA